MSTAQISAFYDVGDVLQQVSKNLFSYSLFLHLLNLSAESYDIFVTFC